MKRLNWFLVISLLLMLTTSFACQSQQLEIRLAPIHEVRVAIAESFPPQVMVYIQGGLADGCTTFHELKTERSDNTVNITVTTQRPKGAVCTQVYGYFEQNVNLGSDFISGETYIINVNDKMTSFVMQ
jgi:inhibitor of cysteine peptidase